MAYKIDGVKNTIINGDCLEELKKFPENSIDTIITDPPYGIGFMGKEWDNFNPRSVKNNTEKSSRKKSYLNPERSTGARRGASPALEAGRYNRTLEGQIGFQNWFEKIAKEMLRVAKPGATLLCFGGSRTFHRLACAIEDAGWIVKDTLAWLHGQGFPKASDIKSQMAKKEEAKTKNSEKWNGWKSHGLKPAFEPIIMAIKPNDGSYAENALKWDIGGLNIDGGKIGKMNRFPANVILDEETAKILDKQSGKRPAGTFPKKRGSTAFFGLGDAENRNEFVGQLKDTGGASRFFYVAKAGTKERNIGLEDFEEKQATDGCIRNNPESVRKYQANSALRKNIHPTVKPLKLMEYLCVLTKTPTGGIVLDPFTGSGTTLMAAKKNGRDFIGIEKEKEYISIAEARIKAIQKNLFRCQP